MLTASLPCSKIFNGNPLNVTIKFTSITVASKDLFKGLSLLINSTHSCFPAPTQICLCKLSKPFSPSTSWSSVYVTTVCKASNLSPFLLHSQCNLSSKKQKITIIKVWWRNWPSFSRTWIFIWNWPHKFKRQFWVSVQIVVTYLIFNPQKEEYDRISLSPWTLPWGWGNWQRCLSQGSTTWNSSEEEMFSQKLRWGHSCWGFL